jgi:hypothetical protein
MACSMVRSATPSSRRSCQADHPIRLSGSASFAGGAGRLTRGVRLARWRLRPLLSDFDRSEQKAGSAFDLRLGACTQAGRRSGRCRDCESAGAQIVRRRVRTTTIVTVIPGTTALVHPSGVSQVACNGFAGLRNRRDLGSTTLARRDPRGSCVPMASGFRRNDPRVATVHAALTGIAYVALSRIAGTAAQVIHALR